MKTLIKTIGLVGTVGWMALCSCAQETELTAEESSLVASADEMIQQEDIVDESMMPIYADSLKEGTYSIEVLSSSSMFRIYDCQLTVKDGAMSARLILNSDSYLKLYMGTGAEAVKDSEEACINYELNEEGMQMYEVPVEALDTGIECAAWSRRREKWYDRILVFCASSLPQNAFQGDMILTAAEIGLEDGVYTVEAELAGGSGKTKVESPVTMTVMEGAATAVVTILSPHYSYVLVDGEKYEKISTEENSTFEIPVSGFDWKIPVKANSTALGTSHEIDYTLYFDADTIQFAEE